MALVISGDFFTLTFTFRIGMSAPSAYPVDFYYSVGYRNNRFQTGVPGSRWPGAGTACSTVTTRNETMRSALRCVRSGYRSSHSPSAVK